MNNQIYIVSQHSTSSTAVHLYGATSAVAPVWPVLALPELLYQILSYSPVSFFIAQLTLLALPTRRESYVYNQQSIDY